MAAIRMHAGRTLDRSFACMQVREIFYHNVMACPECVRAANEAAPFHGICGRATTELECLATQ
jgi:hypothetical protein